MVSSSCRFFATAFLLSIYIDRRGTPVYNVYKRGDIMLVISDVIRGYTDTILLAQLIKNDSYGYEINKTIQSITHDEFELKESTLYTAFRRLETSGYIISHWGDENIGARRRYSL